MADLHPSGSLGYDAHNFLTVRHTLSFYSRIEYLYLTYSPRA